MRFDCPARRLPTRNGALHGARACVAAALLALALGALVYATDRDPVSTARQGPPLFGALGGWLPDFVHPFAFGLLSAVWLSRRPWPAYGACAAWFTVDALFEIGQHAAVAPALAHAVSAVPGVGGGLAGFFMHGTFDPLDLVAAGAGTLAAVAFVQRFLLETPHAQ
jgi:hypothetical protein